MENTSRIYTGWTGYIILMREYEFRYRPKGEKDSSLKYFMANDFKEAKEMFDYACERRNLILDKWIAMRWNRWAKKWEKANG